ncbi:MAG: hypothetical protein H0T80_20600 [Betaproteobacteria bacterium]|nr:hypothetical protein [Betaproteobacteria bacterium]
MAGRCRASIATSLGATVAPGRTRCTLIGGLVCPLTGIAMAALLASILGLDRDQQGLLILFGCLPPAVLNFMVAEQFNQEPAKVASIVLIGNVLSVIFVPLGVALALRCSAMRNRRWGDYRGRRLRLCAVSQNRASG